MLEKQKRFILEHAPKNILRLYAIIKRRKVKYFCPCCRRWYPQMIDGEFWNNPNRFNPDRYKKERQDVICPYCSSLPRHRILVDWIEDHLSLFRNKRILHFAQEYSLKKYFKRNHISVTTADLYEKADLQIDLLNTGLADKSYDVIICNHVLEHVDDYKKGLLELHRILADDGILIISFPIEESYSTVKEDPRIITPEERLKAFGQNDHLRVFGRDSEKIISNCGFHVERIDGNLCPHDIMPVVGPADYDANYLFLCRKSI